MLADARHLAEKAYSIVSRMLDLPAPVGPAIAKSDSSEKSRTALAVAIAGVPLDFQTEWSHVTPGTRRRRGPRTAQGVGLWLSLVLSLVERAELVQRRHGSRSASRRAVSVSESSGRDSGSTASTTTMFGRI